MELEINKQTDTQVDRLTYIQTDGQIYTEKTDRYLHSETRTHMDSASQIDR